MAKMWYPVIDYAVCADCGTCVEHCTHGVYDKLKAPSAVVVYPDGCVDHCHGCGNKCPTGAISYVGDDTDWTPPNGKPETEKPCCDCDCGDTSGNKVLVEYLYLDLNSCERCIGTDKVLDEVMLVLTPALRLAGFDVEYRKAEMASAEIALKYRFLSSPTVRVNGKDICKSVKENSCSCCGEISGSDVDCRVFEFNGEVFEVPPKEMLAKEILSAVFDKADGDYSCGDYELPENLRAFFDGKRNVSSCKCGCGNC